MTAPAINPAMNALPGLAGGGNAQAATGPLAGFEALLAALFGDADIAGVVTGEAGSSPTADETVDPASAATDASAETGTGAETLLNSLLLAQTAPKQPDDAEVEPTPDAAAPAWGQDKAKGAPAAPALANADPSAGLAEKADGEADAPMADPAAPEAAPVTRPTSAAPQAPQTPPAPPSSRAAAVAPQQPPAAAAAAAIDATAEITPPPLEAEAEPLPGTAVAPEALAAPSAREEITRAADAPPPAPPSRKDKKSPAAERAKDGDEAKAEGVSARSATSAAAPAAANAGAKGQAAAKAPEVAASTPEARRIDPPDSLGSPPAESKSGTQSASPTATASHAVRGAPETVANFAAQIVKKLDARSTRFDVQLDPIGLGKVDVRIEIGAHGRMTAAMSFETPQAAVELKSRSGELQRALEQAGFDLSGGLSFDVAGDRGQARQEWNEGQGGGFRGRAFQQALETAGEADLAAASGELRLHRGVTGGVDVRI